MSDYTAEEVREKVDAVYRSDSRRVLATLIRLLGDFDLAEEALHNAFMAAIEQWPRDGVPDSPRAWLVSAGRFKAVDSLRRRARFDAVRADIAKRLDAVPFDAAAREDQDIEDDRLRLGFTCCHPALPPDAQGALTLREVCGLRTEEIATAFLTTPPTIAQRIVRAKGKIRDAHIPYEVPSRADLAGRLDSVLRVIYLVFTEGYSASSGDLLTRPDLSGEAIRLGRLIVELLPEPEGVGLLALMLLQESRRGTRTSPAGELVLLQDQDRSLWNRDQITEGIALVERALASRRFGPYTLQASIAAVHAEAPSAAATDWAQIAGLYDVLLRAGASPVVELKRAVAVAVRDGPSQVSPLSMPSWPAAICRTTTWHTPRGRNYACDWEERRRREPPINGPLSSPGRSRSGGFSSGGFPVCRPETANKDFALGTSVVDFELSRATMY